MTGALLVALVSMAAVLVVPAQGNDPALRALALPALSHGAACPVTTGARGEVPRQEHIFGGDLWFGRGPVRIGLAWKPPNTGDLATFSLAPVPIEDGAPRAKTPWISVPGYAGPIVIRGHALDDPDRTLLFKHEGRSRTPRLELRAPRTPSPELWSFWPSSMWIPGPGCYGLQIDTPATTDVVVFEAT